MCVSCPIINLRVFCVLLFLFSTQCNGCGDSCYPSSSPSLFNVVLLNLWLCILKIEVAVHHTKSKPSKQEHQLSLTHTQPKSIHWFNLPLRLWLATFARSSRKPIATRSALSFNWPLRGKKRCRKYFAQFYSDNNYAVYEWTYIDTHVNLCINFHEGFCCACFGAFDHSPTMTWPRWFHALFFIGLLNYSVWRFFPKNFWLHSGFLLRYSIFFTFWHVRFH